MESEIHVHLYEFTSPELSKALQNAIERGVQVTVLLEGGVYSSWDDMRTSRGIASDLHNAGATVLWMVDPPSASSPEGPYRYIHSKVMLEINHLFGCQVGIGKVVASLVTGMEIEIGQYLSMIPKLLK